MGTSIQNLSENVSFLKLAWGNLRNAVIGCSAAVLFGVTVLLMSILSVTAPDHVFPAGEKTEVKIVYYLPYPGMLPDSPLYRVKALRDKVVLWLTWDENKKAEKELLYADKRIGAAIVLIEGGKTELAVSTATKAEKYLESSVQRVKRLSAKGRDVKSLLGVLQKAVLKHREILESRSEFEPALKINKSLTFE